MVYTHQRLLVRHWTTIIHPKYFMRHDLKEEEEVERKENLNWRVGTESQDKWPISVTREI